MAITTSLEILNFFRSQDKYVLSFAGFGELGYEETQRVTQIIKGVLQRWQPHEILVNSGTLLRVDGQEGIAQVYRIANELGIETTGIHPSISLDFADTHPVSPFSNHSFFVEDATWGGFLNEQGLISPTLEVLLEITDELIVIGGGKHAADELAAFLQKGKKVQYFAAQMNHQVTRDWCEKSGVEIPDLKGAAHQIWTAHGKNEKDK